MWRVVQPQYHIFLSSEVRRSLATFTSCGAWQLLMHLAAV
jgi:hypothetical protein